MARRNTRNRRGTAPSRSFGSTIAWTAVLALVFSAGLIVGQRMLRDSSTPPLLSTSAQVEGIGSSDASPDAARGEATDEPAPLSFSFYEKLGNGDDAKNAASRAPNAGITEKIEQAKNSAPTDGALPARYTLQVGAHPAMHKAKGQMSKLKDRGLEPHIVSVEKGDGGKLYRVRVGKFHSMDEARHFQAELKRSRDMETFVTPL